MQKTLLVIGIGTLMLLVVFSSGCFEKEEKKVEQNYIQVYTDKTTYFEGKNVTIYMTNVGNTTLKQSTGWEDYIIKDSSGNIIYAQNYVTEAFTELPPGKTVTVGTWYQTDKDGNQVPIGTYMVEKQYAGFTDTAKFTIQ